MISHKEPSAAFGRNQRKPIVNLTIAPNSTALSWFP